MPQRKPTRADLDALSRKVPGVYYLPGSNSRPTLTIKGKPRQRKGRSR